MFNACSPSLIQKTKLYSFHILFFLLKMTNNLGRKSSAPYLFWLSLSSHCLSYNYPKYKYKIPHTYNNLTFPPTSSLKRARDNPFSTWKTLVWLSITIKCQASSNLHKGQKLSNDLMIKWKPMLWLQSVRAFSSV